MLISSISINNLLSYYLCHFDDSTALLIADDELERADVDWEQLLAATFDPGDAMLLGPDEMFSLNRNDLLYAQKYAAARSSAPVVPPTAGALNDDDLERCADDLDRFVNDLELACANISQRDAPAAQRPATNADGRDLDPDADPNLGRLSDRSDADRESATANHTYDVLEPMDVRDDNPTGNGPQNSEQSPDVGDDSVEGDSSDGRVLCDPGVSDLRGAPSDPDPGIANGPDIPMYEIADRLVAVSRYPFDPDPEATVV